MVTPPDERLFELLLSQYQDSPNFIKYLQVFTSIHQEIYDALEDTVAKRYYDVAEQAQLDVIGQLVGANRRVLEGTQPVPFFGYEGSVGIYPTEGSGDDADRDVGGLLGSDNGLPVRDFVLNDVQYKQWIDARIIKNTARGTIEDVIRFTTTLLGDSSLQVEVVEPTPASMHIRVHATLSSFNLTLAIERLGHIKPIGVTLTAEDDTGVIEIKKIGY